MKSDTPKPVLLADYRPPDFLIDTVDLDIVLDPTRTRVTSKLTLRRNPKTKVSAKAPLKLDGELLELESILLNGKALKRSAYTANETGLTLKAPPKGSFTLEITTIVNPEANTALQGILSVARRLLLAVRGSGLPPDHLLPRPSRRSGTLHGASRSGHRRRARAAGER